MRVEAVQYVTASDNKCNLCHMGLYNILNYRRKKNFTSGTALAYGEMSTNQGGRT